MTSADRQIPVMASDPWSRGRQISQLHVECALSFSAFVLHLCPMALLRLGCWLTLRRSKNCCQAVALFGKSCVSLYLTPAWKALESTWRNHRVTVWVGVAFCCTPPHPDNHYWKSIVKTLVGAQLISRQDDQLQPRMLQHPLSPNCHLFDGKEFLDEFGDFHKVVDIGPACMFLESILRCTRMNYIISRMHLNAFKCI